MLTLEFSLVPAFWFSAVHDDISEASHGDGEATGWDTTIKMFKASTDDGAWRWRLWTWMRLAKAIHRWCWWWRWDGWHTSAVNISHRRRFSPSPSKWIIVSNSSGSFSSTQQQSAQNRCSFILGIVSFSFCSVESLKMKGFSKQTSSLSLRFFFYFENIFRVPISTSNDLEVALKLPKLTAQFTSRFAPSPHYLIKLKNGHIRAAVMQKKSSKLSEFHRWFFPTSSFSFSGSMLLAASTKYD